MRTAAIFGIGAAVLVVLILTRPSSQTPAGPPPPPVVSKSPEPTPSPVQASVSPTVAEEYRSPWSGFAAGSSVTFTRFEKAPKGEQSMVDRVTVEGPDGAKMKLKLEKLVNNEPAGATTQSLDVECDWGAAVGKEPVDVDGRTLDCRVYLREERTGGQVTRSRRWVSTKVPGRVVREEMEISRGDQKATGAGRMIRLNQTMVVAGKTVTYSVWEETGTTLDGTQIRATRWMTEEIPGFVLKDEKLLTNIQKQEARTVKEVISFEVK